MKHEWQMTRMCTASDNKGSYCALADGVVVDPAAAIHQIRKARENFASPATEAEAFWRMFALENCAIVDAAWESLGKAGINKGDGKELHEVIEEILSALPGA